MLQNLVSIGELCLSRGTPINSKDDDENTGIQLAIMRGHIAITRMLLQRPDIDLNTRNKHGHSALWQALSLSDDDIARQLVDRGCDVNLTSKVDGNSLLHHAIASSLEKQALFLIENGALVDLKNSQRQTPYD
jgi:ankyrin repeat protein